MRSKWHFFLLGMASFSTEAALFDGKVECLSATEATEAHLFGILAAPTALTTAHSAAGMTFDMAEVPPSEVARAHFFWAKGTFFSDFATCLRGQWDFGWRHQKPFVPIFVSKRM